MTNYEKINNETGEITSAIKYLVGSPAEYRFNGQTGNFQYGADTVLSDKNGKALKTFSCIPIAVRMFSDNLFGRNKMDNWVEVFFVDERNRLSHIMLNNSSYNEFLSMTEKLFYDDIELTTSVLTFTPEKIESSKSGEKLSWYACKCTAEPADLLAVQALQDFSQSVPIYAKRTITGTSVCHISTPSYQPPAHLLNNTVELN